MLRSVGGWGVVLAVGAAPAFAQFVQPPASGDWTLAPGASEEMCFELDAGRAIRYEFEAGAPLDFNLHWHRGKEVFFPIRNSAVERRAGVFRAKTRQGYCLMWTNRTAATVPLRAKIENADNARR